MSDMRIKGTYTDSILTGGIKEAQSLRHAERAEFIKNLQRLMLKYKVIKVDVAFDPYKFKEAQ